MKNFDESFLLDKAGIRFQAFFMNATLKLTDDNNFALGDEYDVLVIVLFL